MEMDGMRATALEFRLRFWVFLAVFVLGFTAPWDYWLHLDGMGPNAHLWGMLAALMGKYGVARIGVAFDVVLGVGILLAGAGAWLRVWGAAYLGAGVVQDHQMRGDGVVADGPYRRVRNPLYVGTFLHTLAVALLMPASGAVFAIVVSCVFQARLILGEEAFLAEKLGAGYAAYCARVPRLVPTLRPRVAAGGMKPRWGQAVIGEIYMVGVAGSFAVAGWWYSALLLTRCVLVWLGVSMVARALLMKERPAA
jgi:protein-S-isoprenylcysteine O-methyltransferase Ste14